MKLLPSILGEIIVYEVDISDGIVSTKKSVATYSLKNSGVTLEEFDNEKFNRSKKNGAAVLIITGRDIGSKVYTSSDKEALSKIIENDNLLWTIHEDDGEERIDFTRKTFLDDIFKEIKDLCVANTIVSVKTGIDIYSILQEFYEKKLNFDLVRKSKEFRAFFFDSLFDKIKLPVLLFFFVLLFINYVVFSHIKEKYDTSESTYTIHLQRNNQEVENSEKANRLFGQYNKIPSYPLALLSDRIASYMPKDTRLTSMVFFPEKTPDAIIVKGKSGVAGTALLFAQYLQEDKLFGKVDVININNLKDSDSYDFELRITL